MMIEIEFICKKYTLHFFHHLVSNPTHPTNNVIIAQHIGFVSDLNLRLYSTALYENECVAR